MEPSLLGISFHCRKATQNAIQEYLSNTNRKYYDEIQTVKGGKDLEQSEYTFPVTISFKNHAGSEKRNPSLNILINSNFLEKSVVLEYQNNFKLEEKMAKIDFLFDATGIKELSLKVTDVSYFDKNNETQTSFISNPLLIDTHSLGNDYHGYQSYEEMKVKFLLETYIQNGFLARALLLKSLANLLNQSIKTKRFEFEGEIYILSDYMDSFCGLVQLDIISKLMMYTEDLVIILYSMLLCNGNYYNMLDVDKPDVGNRIKEFLEKHSRDEFSEEQWRKMLSYVDPNKLEIEDAKIALIKRLIHSNINSFRRVITYVQDFGNSHIDASRRYKHAGFPIKLGAKYDGFYPYTTKKYDSYSIVFQGDDPLVDTVPIPFSNRVFESYKILLPTIQDLIKHVIRHKLECILRKTEGIIPLEFYSVSDIPFSDSEISQLNDIIDKFEQEHLYHAYDDDYRFPVNVNRARTKWFVDLDKNIKKWKEIKENFEKSQMKFKRFYRFDLL